MSLPADELQAGCGCARMCQLWAITELQAAVICGRCPNMSLTPHTLGFSSCCVVGGLECAGRAGMHGPPGAGAGASTGRCGPTCCAGPATGHRPPPSHAAPPLPPSAAPSPARKQAPCSFAAIAGGSGKADALMACVKAVYQSNAASFILLSLAHHGGYGRLPC